MLDDLTTVGTGHFQNDTLARVRHLGVVLDLTSVFGNVSASKPLIVRAIDVDQSRITLIVLEDGSANWDITKKAPAQTAPERSKPFAVSLRSFRISGADMVFDNRQPKLTVSLTGFNQSLSGGLSERRVAIVTRARADSATVIFAGIPYLNHVALGLDADVQADLAGKRYMLTKTTLSLNDLELAVSGSAATTSQRTALDLMFKAPSTSFRSILSLVPAIYAHDFAKVKTSGSFTLDGRVKGEYGAAAAGCRDSEERPGARGHGEVGRQPTDRFTGGTGIIRAANERADSLVAAAQRQADRKTP